MRKAYFQEMLLNMGGNVERNGGKNFQGVSGERREKLGQRVDKATGKVESFRKIRRGNLERNSFALQQRFTETKNSNVESFSFELK